MRVKAAIDWDALERCRGDVTELEAIERERPARPGGDQRGNTTDRKRRKLWVIDTFGDGTFVACRMCWITVDYAGLCIDRIVPGHLGGKYVRSNIQPSCSPCQHRQGAEIANARHGR